MAFTTLISTTELATHLGDPNWVIIDCRFSLADTEEGRRDYLQSHIPGAHYAHLDDDLSGKIIPGTTGRHPLPTVEAAADQFSTWGIDEQVQVVVYDDKGGGIAARLWWMLRWLGHEKVAVLNGGWPTWLKAGLPTSAELPSISSKNFQAKERVDLPINRDRVEAIRNDDRYWLIDARAAPRYRGEEEPIDPIAGHIPGAINLPFADNLNTDGTMKNPEALRERFLAVQSSGKVEGAERAAHTVFYCGSGVTACHDILAYEYAGLGEAKLYPGSWSEWITKL
ncbi:MAG: sulfurtransferase [Saprospiraceae bacterium]|nr:MAG: sulfurtransferase [Saprospiraceae bacterium]